MRTKPSPPHLLPLLGLLTVAAAPVQAQLQGAAGTEAGAARPASVRFVPRVSISETATSNVNASLAQQSDLVTRISPGLYASSRGGRVQGFVDYSLIGLLYAQGNRANQMLNALRADGSAEVLEKRGFVDASASITQQSVNPLGTQSLDPQVGRANQTEVRTLQLAPRLQGRLGADLEWTARASHLSSTSTSATTSDFTTSTASLDLGNGGQATRFGWSAQASRTQRSFSLGRTTDDDILRGVLDYRANPEISVGVIGGYESTDIASATKEGRATYGLRLNWTPSARAQLRAEVEKRFFGSAHNLSFSYRWPRAALSFSDSRTMSNGSGQQVQLDENTLYRLAEITPGTVGAEQALQNFWRDRGITFNPNGPVVASFLSSGVTLGRVQQLSLAWLGARDTLTLSVQQNNTERLDNFAGVSDALSLNGAIRQRGYSLTLAHRLTPLSSLLLSLSQNRTIGRDLATELRSASVQWNTQLGPRSTLSLLGRRTLFSSSTQPYDESALIGTFGTTF